jgi:predicted small metal-binding protein
MKGVVMGYSLSCKDMGMTDDFVATGQTEEVLQKAAKHSKEVHGLTDQQLKDPNLIEMEKRQ